MGIIAWIVLGLGAGLLANMLIPGRRSQGLVITWADHKLFARILAVWCGCSAAGTQLRKGVTTVRSALDVIEQGIAHFKI